ncbi:hypothetical protein MHAE_05912 [Mycobacterium haemophilum DSM 44634]|uniref:hypothetical protein n=1 Tax=Mycobacterium haemophilum TaxID=29311 RepID=UPI000655C5C8|nr:hypothetical protein [Mycobacterium haemophilum]AKN18513.1 hypothetical protein B586_06070 [Mycobacterium haemophilum DSM 44634]MCV7339798.1 hypothetical protein [Mycobacterium haemophilum DSM 44634]
MTVALKATDVGADVEVASREDLKTAVANALRRAGCRSFDDLAEQARTRRFTSMRARLAWVAIGDLYQVDLDSEV